MKKNILFFLVMLLFLASQQISKSADGQIGRWPAANGKWQLAAFTHTTQADWMHGQRERLDVRTLDALGTPYGWDEDPRGAMRLRSQPGPWTGHPENPLVVPGEVGAWDDAVISEAKVVFDGMVYHMWYAGRWRDPQGRKTPMDLGYATSADGVHWTKHQANPVLRRGPLGSYDENLVSAPSVLYDGQVFHMWYSAVDFEGDWSISYATSTDGVKWSKSAQNPLLKETHDQRWDAVYIAEPYVLWNGNGFQMWYNGASATTETLLGHATSPDGIRWKRFVSNRPVLTVAPGGQWGDFAVARASVLYDGERYQMWYEGHSGDTWRIGYATSPDGVNWERGPDNPVIGLGEGGAWDSKVASEPNVIFDGQLYRMYHSGYDGDRYRVGLFTAPPIYEGQGIFVSPPVSTSAPIRWGTLACDLSLPPQTGAAFAVSVSADGQTWADFRNLPDFGNLTGPFSGTRSFDLYPLDLPPSRFLRYRIVLTTADPSVSPLIREVRVSEVFPDFSIGLSQEAVSLRPGQRAEVEVSLQTFQGFVSPVQLSISGLPGTLSATWSPGFVTPPGTATLNLEAGPRSRPGTVPLTITAAGGDRVRTAYLSLTLLAPPPTPTPTRTPLPTPTLTPLPPRPPTPTPIPPPPPPKTGQRPLWPGASAIGAGATILLVWALALILVRPPKPSGDGPLRRPVWRHPAWAALPVLLVLGGAYLVWQREAQARQAAADYQALLANWDSGPDAPPPWLDEAQIRQAIQARFVTPRLRTLVVRYLDRTALLNTADLGFRSNVETLVAQAVAANRSEAGQRELEAFLEGGVSATWTFTYTFDEDLLLPLVQNIASEVEKPLVEHAFDEQTLTFRAGQTGVRLDVDESLRRLKAALPDPGVREVELPVISTPPHAWSDDEIRLTLARVAPLWTELPLPAVIQPITLSFDDDRWIVQGGLPAKDWTPTRPMTGYAFLPGQMGWTLDVTTAHRLIRDALDNELPSVSARAITDVVPARLTLADLKPALLDIAGHFDGLTGFYVQDLATGEEIRHHSTVTTSGMSMLKVAIMATAYRAITQPFPAPLQEAMAQMIAHSINEKSNYVILQIGGGDFQKGLERVNETLATLGMRQTYIRQGYRTEAGPSYDPIDVPRNQVFEKNLVSIPPEDRLNVWPDTAMQTSLSDQAILFEALYRGTLGQGKLLEAFPNLTPQDCQAMLDLLKTNPTRTFLGPGFADSVPMAHKNGFGGGTGTDERMNVGIVWPPEGRPYLVGLYQWDKVDWIHWLRVWPQQIEFSTTLYAFFTMPGPRPAENRPR